MTARLHALALLLLLAGHASAKEPKLYKLKFREGTEHCAVVRIPESWQYSPERIPKEPVTGRWELRKDPSAPEPGYLLRWNGEFGYVPPNYSLNVFRLEWTGDRPKFSPVARQRWAVASRMTMAWAGNRGTETIGGDEPEVIVEGKSFKRTGKHWGQTYDDVILSPNKKWLVLQSSDGKIVNRTLFGEGPGTPLAGRIHVDVYQMPAGLSKIRLEIDQTENQGLAAFMNDTKLYENRYLFLRVDPRGKPESYLVCKLPVEP